MLRIILLVLTLLAPIASAQPKLVPQKIILKDGKTFNLNLPADYEIIPAAEGLKRVRFFANLPNEFFAAVPPAVRKGSAFPVWFLS